MRLETSRHGTRIFSTPSSVAATLCRFLKLIILLISAAVGGTDCESVLQSLIWFGFLGVLDKDSFELQFAYDIDYNPVRALSLPVEEGRRFPHSFDAASVFRISAHIFPTK